MNRFLSNTYKINPSSLTNIQFELNRLKNSITRQLEKHPTSHNNVLGLLGELALNESFEDLNDGMLIANPTFAFESWKETQGRGADAEFHLDDDEFTIEMKNRDDYEIPITKFHEEDLARFEMADPDHETLWIEVVSHANFTDKVWKLISKHNIIVIEIGFQIKSYNFEEAKQIIAEELSRKLNLRGYDLTLVSKPSDFQHLDLNDNSKSLNLNSTNYLLQNFTNFIIKKLNFGLDYFKPLAKRIEEATRLILYSGGDGRG